MSDVVDILVAVSLSGRQVAYSSTSPQVQQNGQITIYPGQVVNLTFAPATGQTWQFAEPWITLSPASPSVSIVEVGPAAVAILDDNETYAASGSYSYCLNTTSGQLDPMLINKG